MCKEETQSLDEVADLKIQARKERKKTEVEGESKITTGEKKERTQSHPLRETQRKKQHGCIRKGRLYIQTRFSISEKKKTN